MAWRPAELIPRILQGKPPYVILRHMWTGVGPQSLSYPEKNQGNRRDIGGSVSERYVVW